MCTLGYGATLSDGVRWFKKLSSGITAGCGIEGVEIGSTIGCDGSFGIGKMIVGLFVPVL